MAIFEEVLTNMDDKDHPQCVHPKVIRKHFSQKKKWCSLGSSIKKDLGKNYSSSLGRKHKKVNLGKNINTVTHWVKNLKKRPRKKLGLNKFLTKLKTCKGSLDKTQSIGKQRNRMIEA